MLKQIGLTTAALLVLSVLVGACGPVTKAPAKKTTSASPAAGAKLFRADCVPCHQSNAAGGKMIGTASSADLRQSGLKPLYHNSTKLLERAIMDGRDQSDQPLAPEMIRWRGTLSKTQVDNIIAYLKTVK